MSAYHSRNTMRHGIGTFGGSYPKPKTIPRTGLYDEVVIIISNLHADGDTLVEKTVAKSIGSHDDDGKNIRLRGCSYLQHSRSRWWKLFWVSGHPFKLAQTVYLEVHG